MLRLLATCAASLALTACLSVTGTSDNSGYFYATLRGTVTRASGATVPNAPIGVSCTGAANEPFGFTVDANASGAFELRLDAPAIFRPLDGPSYVCRVLTPVIGLPQAQRTVPVVVTSDRNARPVTTVPLVIP